MELSGTYDLSELEELIRGLLGDEMYDYLSQDAGTEFQALMDLLRAGDFQIRADYESGMLYLTSSSFPSLFSIMGKTYPKDVWLSWDSGLTSAGATATVGAAVAAASLASDLQSPYISPVYYYQNILNAGSMTAAVCPERPGCRRGPKGLLLRLPRLQRGCQQLEGPERRPVGLCLLRPEPLVESRGPAL